jgi:hypothetical protein
VRLRGHEAGLAIALACVACACSTLTGLQSYDICSDCDSRGVTDLSVDGGGGDPPGRDPPNEDGRSASDDASSIVDASGLDAAAKKGDDGGMRGDSAEGGGGGNDATPEAASAQDAPGPNSNDATAIVESGVDASDTLSTGLFAYYPFDETSGTTGADATGRNGAAMLMGNATFSPGLKNNALTLGGTQDYASLPQGIVSTLVSFSISVWVNPQSVATWSRVFDFGTGTTKYMFFTLNTGQATEFGMTTSSPSSEEQLNSLDTSSAQTLQTGIWQHVVVTLSGNTATMYVQGSQVAQNTHMTLSPMSLGATTQNWLGRSQYGYNPYMAGQIDNLRIYSRALTQTEVSELYTGEL